jgi:hypothetical protein
LAKGFPTYSKIPDPEYQQATAKKKTNFLLATTDSCKYQQTDIAKNMWVAVDNNRWLSIVADSYQ